MSTDVSIPFVADVFGWFGTIITLYCYISSSTAFIEIIKGKINYEDVSGVGVLINYCYSIAWYVYGDMIGSFQLKVCNCLGGVFSLLLLIIYLIYEGKKYLFDSILNAITITLGTLAAFKLLNVTIHDREIVGKICVVASMTIFYLPIQDILRLMDDDNYNPLSIITIITSLIGYICWIIYGLILSNYYIAIPNGFCIALAIVQSVFWGMTRNKYSNLRSKPIPKIDIEATTELDKKDDESKELPVKIIE